MSEEGREAREALRALGKEQLETRQILRAISERLQALGDDVRRLVAQIRALIRGRRNGGSTP
jgi:hypothetical protein